MWKSEVILATVLVVGVLQASAAERELVVVRKLTLQRHQQDLPGRQTANHPFRHRPQVRPAGSKRNRQASSLRLSGGRLLQVSVASLKTHPVAKSGSTQVMDADVAVEEGEQYRLKTIRFVGRPAFPESALRAQFPISDGSVFKRSKIGFRLENLRQLYGSQGICKPLRGTGHNG
jgi:hypothetical protein